MTTLTEEKKTSLNAKVSMNQWVAGSNPATPVDRILILSYTTSCVKEDALGEQSPTLRV